MIETTMIAATQANNRVNDCIFMLFPFDASKPAQEAKDNKTSGGIIINKQKTVNQFIPFPGSSAVKF